MDTGHLRKLLLKIFIAFLGLTALIAIISVLAGDFGEVQLKILATTSIISGAAICSMSCAAFIGKGRQVGLGSLGILFSVAAAVFAIAGMWPQIENEVFWQFTLTLTVLAVAIAHAFLLLLPELDKEHKWIQTAATAAIAGLSLLLIVAVWGKISSEEYYRFVAVAAIIVALLTLVVPIMMKMRRGDGQKRERIVLERVDGDIFRDVSGKRFQLKEIDTGVDDRCAAIDREDES